MFFFYVTDSSLRICKDATHAHDGDVKFEVFKMLQFHDKINKSFHDSCMNFLSDKKSYCSCLTQ